MLDLGRDVLFKGKNMARLLGGLWVALRISLLSVAISIPLGILTGIVIGFILPSLSAYTYKIQNGMNTLYPTLARPMTMRSSRYNQQLCSGSLLVEVGTHGNTLQEALAGARLFARAAGQVLLGLEG